jgi:hypothetical protein
VLLVGGAGAFAGQALDDAPRRPPVATAPPPPALTLLAASESVTQHARTALTALRPQGLRVDQSYRVRVYVNGERVRERDLPSGDSFELTDIPLSQGPNLISAALVGDGGEGPRSAEIGVVRDDQPAEIQITQPAARETIYSDSVLLRGRTEPGASVSITLAGSGREIETTLGEGGRFSAVLDLRMGNNNFVIRSVDVAGNRSSARITVVRADSSARLTLSVNPDVIDAESLPASVTINATVRDEVGRLVDGVEVTFGISPPDSTTQTFRETTTNGRARSPELTLTAADSPGVWLVTVSARLPSGVELRQNGSFSVE